MKFKKVIVIITLSLLTMSCGKYENKDHIITSIVNPVNSIANINDSVFFGQISQIIASNGKIYCSDIKNESILKFDDSLNYISRITFPGDAIKTLKGIGRFGIDNSKIFMINDRAIVKIYSTEGKYIKQFVYKNIGPIGNFVVDDSLLYIPNSDSKNIVTVYNTDGELVKTFGPLNLLENYSEIIERNRFDLFIINIDTKKLILAVNRSELSMLLFDFSGKYYGTLKSDSLMVLKKIHQFTNQFYENRDKSNSIANSFVDAYTSMQVVNQTLYFSPWIMSDENSYRKPDQLVKLCIKNLNVFEEETIHFDDNSGSAAILSFAVNGSYVYLFNALDFTIRKYRL